MAPPFDYLRLALTLDEFKVWVGGHNFGSILPDTFCFHHTAIPDISWATGNASPLDNWDANEAGLDLEGIRKKRLAQLDNVMRYYRDTLKWSAGPHFFFDNLFVYVFTDPRTIGIHAKWGNSFHDATGRLHYSLGGEVIGDYTRVQWPIAVQRVVGGAVAHLKNRLKTFELEYLYPDPAQKPGRAVKTVNGKAVEYCPHPERLKWGGLFSHRDTNKPACPGNAITEAFYVGVCQEQWTRLYGKPTTETLEGVARRRITVASTVAAFYQAHGGLLTFGYPLDHELAQLDALGERCGYLITEFAVIKRKPSEPSPWDVRLAPRDEADAVYASWRALQPDP